VKTRNSCPRRDPYSPCTSSAMQLIDFSDDEPHVVHEMPQQQQLDGLHTSAPDEALLAFDHDNQVDEDISDSESESAESSPAVQAQIQKNKANRDAFNEFLQLQNDEQTTTQDFDDTFTSKTLESSKRIIDDPRDYQTELFERAKKENIIAVLDTGSGKTLIAALLMRHVAWQELEDRANGKEAKMSFFLVNSVHLVRQQQRMLANNLPEAPKAVHGGGKDDLWKKVEWDKLKAQNKAIVCTAEVLNQCLMHSFVKIEEINLLIFDEAHHAKKGHPYARIIKDYYLAQSEPSLRPKIFGMTASPVDAITDLDVAAQ
jgi:endoribonuclease Dicer